MPCLTPWRESVASLSTPMVCLYDGDSVREFIVQLCVHRSSATARVTGSPLRKDVEVCHWASLRECSQTLSYGSSRLPAEVYNA